jgi:hypothetical protein
MSKESIKSWKSTIVIFVGGMVIWAGLFGGAALHG